MPRVYPRERRLGWVAPLGVRRNSLMVALWRSRAWEEPLLRHGNHDSLRRRKRGENGRGRLPSRPDRWKRRWRSWLGRDRAARGGRHRPRRARVGRRARPRNAGPRAGDRARLRPRLGRLCGVLRPPRPCATPGGPARRPSRSTSRPWRPSGAARRPGSRPGPSGSRCRRCAGGSPLAHKLKITRLSPSKREGVSARFKYVP